MSQNAVVPTITAVCREDNCGFNRKRGPPTTSNWSALLAHNRNSIFL